MNYNKPLIKFWIFQPQNYHGFSLKNYHTNFEHFPDWQNLTATLQYAAKISLLWKSFFVNVLDKTNFL